MNRIITVIDQYYPFSGGAENVAKVIAEMTSTKGISHDVLTIAKRELDEINGNTLLPKEKINNNYSIFRFRYTTIGEVEKNGPYFQYVTLLKYIYHLIKLRDTFDIIHAHTFYWPASAAIIAGKILRKPVVVTGHSTLVRLQEEVQAKEVPAFFLSILKYCNYFVAINDVIAEEACWICSIPSERVKVIYNGIDTLRYKPISSSHELTALRSQLQLPIDQPVIIIHGRLDNNKNIETLIKAISRMVNKGNIDPYLVIIGQGPEKTKFIKLTESLQVQKHVFFAGFKSNVYQYLQAADIHCLPSHREGLPLALMEAMASGLICVSSNIPGNRTLIQDKINGLLFEATNIDQLAKLLSYAILNKRTDEMVSLKNAAQQTIIENFDLEKMVERYLSLYNIM